jgi:hypothetical protein
MPDRIEREIEEILARLDVGSESDTITGERAPISIETRRGARKRTAKRRRSLPKPGLNINPASLLLAGAGVMVAGLVLANWWEPFIWLSFSGVLLFIGAFAWSFNRRPRGGGVEGGPRTVYWRDRYIEVGSHEPGPVDRVKRFFRRR